MRLGVGEWLGIYRIFFLLWQHDHAYIIAQRFESECHACETRNIYASFYFIFIPLLFPRKGEGRREKEEVEEEEGGGAFRSGS